MFKSSKMIRFASKNIVPSRPFSFSKLSISKTCTLSSLMTTAGVVSTPRRTATTHADEDKVPVAVKKLFDTVVAAIDPMLEDNPGLVVSHNLPSVAGYKATREHEHWGSTARLEIELPESQGSYIFIHVPSRSASSTAPPRVTMASPVSGAGYTYSPHPTEGWWAAEEDGHWLPELVTREMIRMCKGYPNF